MTLHTLSDTQGRHFTHLIKSMGRLLASAPLRLALISLLLARQISGQPLLPDAAALARCDTSQEAREQIANKAVRALWETGDFQVIKVRACFGSFRMGL